MQWTGSWRSGRVCGAVDGVVVQWTGLGCSRRGRGAVHGFVVQWTGLGCSGRVCGAVTTKVLFMFFCRCYIPCDATCSANKYIPRTPTAVLWKASDNNVELCYSYQNCGSRDFFTNKIALDCRARGGWITDVITMDCTCDTRPESCKALTTTTVTGMASPISLGVASY